MPRGSILLAYGTRDPADGCWYPDSRKISWRGLGVIHRVEPLDYWDGEADDRNFKMFGTGQGDGRSVADIPEDELLEGFGE